jgi:hypothetical protein
LAAPPLDNSALDFAHDMLMKLHGVSWQGDPNSDPGGSPSRYADTFRGEVNGREIVLSNVSFTWSFLHGGEHPVAGGLCSMKLGFLLPLVLVSPRSCEPHMRAMTKVVKVGQTAFDARFEVRSGHPDYAVALVTPMADEILTRDDWAFFLEFGTFVSLAAAPFATLDEVTRRVEAMARLVALIPAPVRDAYEVKVGFQSATSEDLSTNDHPGLSAEDQQRARQLLQAMPPEQRSALVARMRTEGPEAVIRELLGNER